MAANGFQVFSLLSFDVFEEGEVEVFGRGVGVEKFFEVVFAEDPGGPAFGACGETLFEFGQGAPVIALVCEGNKVGCAATFFANTVCPPLDAVHPKIFGGFIQVEFPGRVKAVLDSWGCFRYNGWRNGYGLLYSRRCWRKSGWRRCDWAGYGKAGGLFCGRLCSQCLCAAFREEAGDVNEGRGNAGFSGRCLNPF